MFVGFESFKKVAAVVDEDFLERIGEYDPCMFEQEICDNGGFVKTKEVAPKKADAPQGDANRCNMAIDTTGGGDYESGLFEFSPFRGTEWHMKNTVDEDGVPYFLQANPVAPHSAALTVNKPSVWAVPVLESIGKPCDVLNKHGRKYRGVDASKIGVCLHDNDVKQCNGGTFISGFCRSSPSYVRCCVNQVDKPCNKLNRHGVKWKGQDVSKIGTCQVDDSGRCEDGEFISGYCRAAPNNVRCCVKTSD